jgi:hypothetical protein
VERWRDDLFCFRGSGTGRGEQLHLVENAAPVLGMKKTPRLKTRFLLDQKFRTPAVPYGTGKLKARRVRVSSAVRATKQDFLWRNYLSIIED